MERDCMDRTSIGTKREAVSDGLAVVFVLRFQP